MPCYTVQSFSVAFKTENVDLLELALKAENIRFQKTGNLIHLQSGYNGQIVINLDTNEATLTGSNRDALQSDLNKLKRAYSLEAIKVVAKKQHWTMKQKSSDKYSGSLLKRG